MDYRLAAPIAQGKRMLNPQILRHPEGISRPKVHENCVAAFPSFMLSEVVGRIRGQSAIIVVLHYGFRGKSQLQIDKPLAEPTTYSL